MIGPRLREADEADYRPLAALISLTHPANPATEESLRSLDRYLTMRGRPVTRIIASDSSGEPVGHAAMYGTGPNPGIDIGVLSARRRTGIGTALLNRLEQIAARRGARALRTLWVAEADLPAMGFLSGRGYVELERASPSSLDLTTVGTGQAATDRVQALARRSGITFTTLARDGTADAVLRRICALHNACLHDVPRIDPYEELSFPAWRTWMVESPHAIPEAFFLACADDQYVGLSVLDRSGPADTLHQGFTGVLRSHRRLGIARALKMRAIAFARAAGYRSIRTRQVSTNIPMLRLNAELGFAPGPAELRLEKVLHPD